MPIINVLLFVVFLTTILYLINNNSVAIRYLKCTTNYYWFENMIIIFYPLTELKVQNWLSGTSQPRDARPLARQISEFSYQSNEFQDFCYLG